MLNIDTTFKLTYTSYIHLRKNHLYRQKAKKNLFLAIKIIKFDILFIKNN